MARGSFYDGDGEKQPKAGVPAGRELVDCFAQLRADPQSARPTAGGPRRDPASAILDRVHSVRPFVSQQARKRRERLKVGAGCLASIVAVGAAAVAWFGPERLGFVTHKAPLSATISSAQWQFANVARASALPGDAPLAFKLDALRAAESDDGMNLSVNGDNFAITVLGPGVNIGMALRSIDMRDVVLPVPVGQLAQLTQRANSAASPLGSILSLRVLAATPNTLASATGRASAKAVTTPTFAGAADDAHVRPSGYDWSDQISSALGGIGQVGLPSSGTAPGGIGSFGDPMQPR